MRLGKYLGALVLCALVNIAGAQVSYFPVRGEAVCPTDYALGLAVTGTAVQCIKASGVVAPSRQDGDGVRIVVSGNCPVQTGNLTSFTAYYGGTGTTSINAACGYSTGAVTAGTASIAVGGAEPGNVLLSVAWCFAVLLGWWHGLALGREKGEGWLDA